MKRLYLFLTIFMLSIICIHAGEKIHVGDMIPLELKTSLTEEELRGKFGDFYIEDMEEEEDGYKLSLRPRKPENTLVKLGNKNIDFEVEALLKDKNDLEVEEMTGNSNQKLKDKSFPYYIFSFYLLLPLVYFWKVKEGPCRIKEESPDREFEKAFGNLKEGEEFVFDLSRIFRRYLDRVEGSKLLYGDFELENEEVKSFLLYLEELKYTKEHYASNELKDKAMELYSKLRGGENV